MLSSQQFNSVFSVPEAPSESEVQIVSAWLFNHEHNQPSQRTKSAIRSLTGQSSLNILLDQYFSQIILDSFEIEIYDVTKLIMMKEYFMFPVLFFQLTDAQYVKAERIVNSILRSKLNNIEELLGEHEDFVSSLGIDIREISKFNHEQKVNDEINKFARSWTCSFKEQVDGDEVAIRALVSLRINEIFEIVANFPESAPALLDIKYYIKPQERSRLVTSFIKDCQKYLLHAGTNTDDIISFYTLTIKSFLCVDPRGVLLDNCSRSIRRYLRERSDTVRNIVKALLETGSTHKLSSLSLELSKEQDKQTTNLSLDWTADPIDALPDFKKKDIIESLMSIFENKDTFVTELVEIFAAKLLTLEDNDLMDVITKLEQLRSRFEEKDLNNIDVMVNDIKVSSNLDQNIQRLNPNMSKKISFLILSHMYWPEMEIATFKLPDLIQEQIQAYFTQFANLKKGRCMNWVNSGVVSLDIEIEGNILQFEVTPACACVINMFNERERLSLEEVSKELQMDKDTAKAALDFWARQRILKDLSNEIFQTSDS